MTRTGIGRLFLLTLFALVAPAAADQGAVLYPTRYYPGVADSALALPITLSPGQTWTGVDLAMDAAGGALRGLLVWPAGAGPQPEPLDGVLVEAVCRGRRVLTRTGADGRFRLSGVPAGLAVVRYSTDDERTRETRAQAVFHPGVADLESAAWIAVSDGQEVDLGSVSLRPGVRLGGVVRTADGGAPMGGVEVRIFLVAKEGTARPAEDPAGDAAGDPARSFPGDGGVWRERTRADGSFLQGGLPSGSYTVFADVTGTDQISEYLGGSRDLAGAEALTLRAGESRLDLRITPDRGGAIGGQVREEGTEAPLAALEVQAIEESSGAIWRGVTGPFGGYRVGGLPSGRYRVFVPAIRKYYPDARRPEDARVLSVSEPLEVLGVNLRGSVGGGCQLPAGSQGTITGGIVADFASVERAVVRAWSAVDTFDVPVEFPGIYTLTCMTAGDYRVALLADGPLRAQYYKRVNDPAQATLVTVAPPDSSTGIDFSPEPAVRIEGTVRDRRSGAGLEGVLVSAVETRSGVRAETLTEAGGAFVLARLGPRDSPDIRTGLPAGSWRVAAETTLVDDPILTPVLQPEIRARAEAAGLVRVEWELPSGPAWSYEVHREDAALDPVLIDSAGRVSAAEEPFALVDGPLVAGRFRYRLTASIVSPGGLPPSFRAESEWVDVDPAAGAPAARWRILARPAPWNGRESVQLTLVPIGQPVAALSAEATGQIRVLAPSGRTVAICRSRPGSTSFAWDGRDGAGRAAGSGWYFLRHELLEAARPGGGSGATGAVLLVR